MQDPAACDGASRISVGLESRSPDPRTPLLVVWPPDGAGLARPEAGGFDAQRLDLLPQVGLPDGAHGRPGELVDDLPGRAGRREQRVPGRAFDVVAALLEGRHVGILRRAPGAG